MSYRHFFDSKSTLVDQFLLGFAATRPDLHLKRSARVLHRAERDVPKVALISGGGAGHEPGAVGMVGKGGLDAAVIGDVFASPRAEQVLLAIEAVPSEAGTILVVPNCERTETHSHSHSHSQSNFQWVARFDRLRYNCDSPRRGPADTSSKIPATISISVWADSWPRPRGRKTSKWW